MPFWDAGKHSYSIIHMGTCWQQTNQLRVISVRPARNNLDLEPVNTHRLARETTGTYQCCPSFDVLRKQQTRNDSNLHCAGKDLVLQLLQLQCMLPRKLPILQNDYNFWLCKEE